MTHTIWIDVEDLFEYAVVNTRPSGIQRLSFQLYRALHEQDCGRGHVRFVRHLPYSSGLRSVEWCEVAALFGELTQSPQPAGRAVVALSPTRARVRAMLLSLPPRLRVPVSELLVAVRETLRALVKLVRVCRKEWAGNKRVWRSRSSRQALSIGVSLARGDVLLSLGSPWANTRYPGLIGSLRDSGGLRFATLVYDLIPLRRPEWCDADLTAAFRGWYETMLPLCDHVFAISRATASDVGDYARERRLDLLRPVVTLPLGTEPDTPSSANGPVREMPPAGTYALIVATIEARKNHLLLFRVWRRLLDELPREDVPTLVFAGRVGWLVDDLMRQIANTENLGGKLVFIDGPTDSELAVLYRGCLFTLFPSFIEGWGLPISESLAFGKPCIISNRSSLPEAGGTLARMFDPDDLNDAFTVIRETIADRDGLATWEARVKREFRTVPWSVTADALVSNLAAPAMAA